jgi:hypothetical protein
VIIADLLRLAEKPTDPLVGLAARQDAYASGSDGLARRFVHAKA